MPPQKPTYSGQPYVVQQAFDRLYEHARTIEQAHTALRAQVDQMPAPLTLDQIKAALEAGGSHPLNLTNLPGSGAVVNPTTNTSGDGGGGTSGGDGGSTGGGTPIVPMSADPATCTDQIRRSLYYYGRTDSGYWVGLIHCPTPWGPMSDGKFYVGFDAYMEARMAPGDTGSADNSLLPLPAVHQAPVPPGYPPGGWT